jgi:hypothetical protein
VASGIIAPEASTARGVISMLSSDPKTSGPRVPSWRSVTAVLVGGLVDIACSIVWSIVVQVTLGIVDSAVASIRHGSPVSPAGTPSASSTALVIFQMLSGTGFTVLGGVVAGRIATSRERVHGAAVGVFGIGLGFVLTAVTKSQSAMPAWYWVVSYLVMIPAAVAGGHLAGRRKQTLAAIRAAHGVKAANEKPDPAGQDLVRYFTRLAQEQPGVDEWSEGAALARRWIALKEGGGIQAEVTALLEALARRKDPGSGWHDLWMRVRNWAIESGFDVGRHQRNPWAAP